MERQDIAMGFKRYELQVLQEVPRDVYKKGNDSTSFNGIQEWFITEKGRVWRSLAVTGTRSEFPFAFFSLLLAIVSRFIN